MFHWRLSRTQECQEHGFYAGFFTFILELIFPFIVKLTNIHFSLYHLGARNRSRVSRKHIYWRRPNKKTRVILVVVQVTRRNYYLYGKRRTPYRPRIKSSSLSPSKPFFIVTSPLPLWTLRPVRNQRGHPRFAILVRQRNRQFQTPRGVRTNRGLHQST